MTAETLLLKNNSIISFLEKFSLKKNSNNKNNLFIKKLMIKLDSCELGEVYH